MTIWNEKLDSFLVSYYEEICIEKGIKTLKKADWIQIVKALNDFIATETTATRNRRIKKFKLTQVRSRWGYMRKNYQNMKKLLATSGAGWDPIRFMVELSDDRWNSYTGTELYRYRNFSFPQYEMMDRILGNRIAVGKNVPGNKGLTQIRTQEEGSSELDTDADDDDPVDNNGSSNSSVVITGSSTTSTTPIFGSKAISEISFLRGANGEGNSEDFSPVATPTPASRTNSATRQLSASSQRIKPARSRSERAPAHVYIADRMDNYNGDLMDVLKSTNQSLQAFKDCFTNDTQKKDEEDQIAVYRKLVKNHKFVSPLKLFDFLSEKPMMARFLLSLSEEELDSLYTRELYIKLEDI